MKLFNTVIHGTTNEVCTIVAINTLNKTYTLKRKYSDGMINNVNECNIFSINNTLITKNKTKELVGKF